MKESMNMGGSLVSRNILENKGRLKWCVRSKPCNQIDNGWRFFSDIDTKEYLADPKNLVVCDWGTVFEMEPAVMMMFDMPYGTEITLVIEDGRRFFIDTNTGEKIVFY